MWTYYLTNLDSFFCFFITSSSILSIMQMYPQGRMSHHFREMKVGDYLSVKGPKVIIMFWASDLPSLGFFYFYRKHQLLSAEVNSNGFSLIPVWGLHFYCMHICLQLGGEYDFFSVVGSFQVPSWPSESIWNAGWWIRHYSNVPSNNQTRVLYCDWSCYKALLVINGLCSVPTGCQSNSWEP